MEKFHFKLEKILQYRIGLTEEAERQLAVIVGQCNALTTKIDQFKSEQRRSRLSQAGGDLAMRQVSLMYDERLSSQLKQFEIELSLLNEKKVALQQNYRDKLQDQKVLENLKENQQKEYKIKLARYRDKVMDDLIASRHGKD